MDLEKTVDIETKQKINADLFYLNSDSKKQNKFKQFLSLFSPLNKLLKTKQRIVSNPFEVQASSFLSEENYQGYINMLQQGYEPTQEQSKFMDQLVHDLFFNRIKPDEGYGWDRARDMSELEKILSLGYQLKTNDVVKFSTNLKNNLFEKYEDFVVNNNNITISTFASNRYSYPVLSTQIKKIMKEEDFKKQISNLFQSSLEYNTNVRNAIKPFHYILKNAPELILNDIPFIKFVDINNKLKKEGKNKDMLELMNDLINNFYTKDMQDFYMSVKSRYTTDFVENLIVNKINQNLDTLKQLPPEALDLLNSIDTTFKNIQKKNNTSNDIEQLTLMLDKRIPEILSKYLTIDPEYRTTLKNNEGLNAQELMIESLKNIQSLFLNFYQEMNQEHVNSLSATKRYTSYLK